MHENILFHETYKFYTVTLNHWPVLCIPNFFGVHKYVNDDQFSLTQTVNPFSAMLDLIGIDFNIFELKYRYNVIDYAILYDYYKNINNIFLYIIYQVEIKMPNLDKLYYCLYVFEQFDKYIIKHLEFLQNLALKAKPSLKFDKELNEERLLPNEGNFDNFHNTFFELRERIYETLNTPTN